MWLVPGRNGSHLESKRRQGKFTFSAQRSKRAMREQPELFLIFLPSPTKREWSFTLCYMRQPSWIVSGNINWYSHYRKLYRFLKILNIEPQYDWAIFLLGFHLKETKILIWKDICTPMLVAALFTMAKLWMQSQCPLTTRWIARWMDK